MRAVAGPHPVLESLTAENGAAKLDHISGLVFRHLPAPSLRRSVVYFSGAALVYFPGALDTPRPRRRSPSLTKSVSRRLRHTWPSWRTSG